MTTYEHLSSRFIGPNTFAYESKEVKMLVLVLGYALEYIAEV